MCSVLIRYVLAARLLLCFHESVGQTTQTVKGTVVDEASAVPLIGATVQVLESKPILGTSTNAYGDFALVNVPIGRVTLAINYLGYEPVVLPNIEVTAGKEVVLNLSLTESISTLTTAEVIADVEPGEVGNEMAFVSARQLSMLEANRYAASIGDPARQAQNFAGVNAGNDDLANEIIVRGNSSRGLLWRLEGIEIPNPNHFSGLGASGGGVSMLSSNVLANSDFFTGAFPAEYGNAASGIFDIKYRRGNRDKRELTFAAGVLGVEAAAEGPIKQGSRASYLVNYRFSTLSLLSGLGINVVGDLLPNYQDASLHLDFPTAKAGRFSIFGLGGNNWFTSDFAEEDLDGNPVLNGLAFAEEVRARMGVLGVKHRLLLSDQLYVHTVASTSSSRASEATEQVLPTEKLPDFQENYGERATRISQLWNYKINAHHTLRAGGIFNVLRENFDLSDVEDGPYRRRHDFTARTTSVQGYLQWKWRLSEVLTANSGAHYFRYDYTGSQRLEPRAGVRIQLSPKHALTSGVGLHSRAESVLAYAAQQTLIDGTIIRPNTTLGLGRAAHAVLGYEIAATDQLYIKLESYYQALSDVPVSSDPSIQYSALNVQSTYSFIERNDTLVNNGTGRNYGLELTVERSLANNYYYLITASLYDAEFSLDGQRYYDNRFNGGYIANVVGGRDWSIGKGDNNTVGVNARATLSGGQRYTPIDVAASRAAGASVLSDTPFSAQQSGYWRIDLAGNYTINRRSTTHTLSLSVQNLTNRLNEANREERYDLMTDSVVTRVFTQSGTLPILKWVVQF